MSTRKTLVLTVLRYCREECVSDFQVCNHVGVSADAYPGIVLLRVEALRLESESLVPEPEHDPRASNARYP